MQSAQATRSGDAYRGLDDRDLGPVEADPGQGEVAEGPRKVALKRCKQTAVHCTVASIRCKPAAA